MVSQAQSGPSNHLLIAGEVVKRSLAESIDQTLKSANLNRDHVVCVSAGLAGVDFDGAGVPEMKALFRELSVDRAVINGDMVILGCRFMAAPRQSTQPVRKSYEQRSYSHLPGIVRSHDQRACGSNHAHAPRIRQSHRRHRYQSGQGPFAL